ncbi:Hypothetical protein I595_2843 [Croceitalea dokdonensis DOKDO 023]|uniref:Uncharacterized protein n=1 Tax=Croceitalea dokdonensis DOKDO 023 TaxID=1300341 RepID=A0A0P7APP8_9FLAO|nr:Hypothetical protein I595_2843 [Croceitalea dokdonensis DOKDO 023]
MICFQCISFKNNVGIFLLFLNCRNLLSSCHQFGLNCSFSVFNLRTAPTINAAYWPLDNPRGQFGPQPRNSNKALYDNALSIGHKLISSSKIPTR